MGNQWDRMVEDSGWIFVQSGAAYAAVRPVLLDVETERPNWKSDEPTVRLRTDAYEWDEQGEILLLEDKHTSVVIEAGHRNDYTTLEDFMADVLDNPLALYRGATPGNHTLVYTGSGSGAQEITFGGNAPQLPTVGGEPIDYSHPFTFDSPTMQSVYKSGVIRIQYDGESLTLDFTRD